MLSLRRAGENFPLRLFHWLYNYTRIVNISKLKETKILVDISGTHGPI